MIQNKKAQQPTVNRIIFLSIFKKKLIIKGTYNGNFIIILFFRYKKVRMNDQDETRVQIESELNN